MMRAPISRWHQRTSAGSRGVALVRSSTSATAVSSFSVLRVLGRERRCKRPASETPTVPAKMLGRHVGDLAHDGGNQARSRLAQAWSGARRGRPPWPRAPIVDADKWATSRMPSGVGQSK